MAAQTAERVYRGYRRCSRIDYADSAIAFEVTICVKPRRTAFVTTDRNTMLIAELQRIQDEGAWGVYAYCIMPDHVHLIVNPGPKGLACAVRLFKGRIAAWWRRSGDGQPLWQTSFFDHRIRSCEGFQDKCEYVFQNPVRAGLVARAKDYPWAGSLVRR